MPLKATQLFGLVLSLVLLLLLANFLIISNNLQTVNSFAKDDVVLETIRSPKAVIFKSESTTNTLADKSIKDVSDVYKLDQAAFSRQQEIIGESFEKIELIISSSVSPEEKRQKIQSIFEENITDNYYNTLITFSLEERRRVSREVEEVLLDIHKTERITDETIGESRKKIASKISSELPPLEIELVSFFARALLITNTIPDAEETLARQDEAKEDTEPVYYQVQKDEVIITKGEVITDLAIEKLRAVGLLSPGFAIMQHIGTTLLISMLGILLFWYAIRNEKNIRRLFAMWSIVCVGTIALILVSRYFLDAKPILAYIVPVAAAAIATGLISRVRIGIFTGLFFTIIISFSFSNLFDVLVVHSVLTIVGLLIFQGLEHFRSLAKPVAILSAVHYVLIIAFHFLSGSLTLLKAGELLLMSVTFSISTVVIVIVLLLLMSFIFKIATFPMLLDLANPTSPLLKELSIKAPGTYHHSLIVGSLAERAVRDVGGDVLLAKVASYYHDIGKLNDPHFYIENIKGTFVTEKKIDPLKQAQKVMSHVDYGIVLARKHRLPQEIIDVITQHHGTTIVWYFYNLSDKNAEKEFRYQGPKPQTRETAIIMLADSVEAYVRSEHEKEGFKLKSAVAKIIKDRLGDGQLEDSNLTLKEISQIHLSFVEILSSVYHERISYE